jgi:hypothetical protein
MDTIQIIHIGVVDTIHAPETGKMDTIPAGVPAACMAAFP